MKPLLFCDTMIMDGQARLTAEGYLVAAPRIARTGIQQYLASELGLTDRAANDVVNIYRPEKEVFSMDALKSLAHMPITVNHPEEFVDAKNWRDLTHGLTGGEVARDGDFIRVPMTLMDAQAVEQVRAGKKELSVGYYSDLEWTAGVTEKGERYDAVQTNIRGNHLAIVDRARGGRQLRVIDHSRTHNREEPTMKTLLIDGITVTLDDTAHQVITKMQATNDAALVTLKQTIADRDTTIATLNTQAAAAATSLQTKDSEIATLKQQLADAILTPAKLDDAVRARATVVDAARKVLSTVVVDGKTESEIRRQVVDSKMGDKAKGWNDDQIAASFNTLTAGVVDSVRAAHMHSQPNVQTTDADAAHKQYVDGLNSAWKGGNTATTH